MVKKIYFSFILLFFMISTTSGMLVSSGSIKTLYYELMSTGVVEDGKILFAFDPTDEILKSIEKTNVKVEKAPYVDAKINKIKDDKDEKTIRLYTNRKNINFPVINEGNLAKNKNEIAINKLFAENNDLKVGDTITFKKEFFKDNKERSFKIVGLIATPDYNSSFQKSTDLIFNAIDFWSRISI